MAMKRRWVANTVLLKQVSHMIPLTVWESSGRQQCVTPSLANFVSTLLLIILHPPLPLQVSPCHLPLPMSTQCSTTDCLFFYLLPICPLAIAHTMQHYQLFILHHDCNRSQPHWRASMTSMTTKPFATSGGHPMGSVGALSHQPHWCASMTSMTIMQHEVTCCPIPIALLCCWTCHTFIPLSCLPCCPVVPSVALHCCTVGGMVAWHQFWCGGGGPHCYRA